MELKQLGMCSLFTVVVLYGDRGSVGIVYFCNVLRVDCPLVRNLGCIVFNNAVEYGLWLKETSKNTSLNRSTILMFLNSFIHVSQRLC